MNIPFVRLPESDETIRNAHRRIVSDVIEAGCYIAGDQLEAFEEAFARYCGARYCVGVANGLDALMLSLMALGIGDGDEVLVPAQTFIATWLAVSRCGARPVPIDQNEATHNIDVSAIENRITARTRAIIVVHLYGQPCDMDAIHQVADQYGLAVIEDAAQAHGARYKGRRVGGLGTIAAFSFYPAKNLGALGDGGAVVCNDSDTAVRLRKLRNYGSIHKYQHELMGVNSRLDELQAAILNYKLGFLDDWNERRRKLANLYLEELKGVRGLRLPHVPEWAEPVWHLFVVSVEHRDHLMRVLTERGISTMMHYPILPGDSEAYRSAGFSSADYPVASRLVKNIVSLPISAFHEETEILQVIEAIHEVSTHL